MWITYDFGRPIRMRFRGKQVLHNFIVAGNGYIFSLIVSRNKFGDESSFHSYISRLSSEFSSD